MFSKIRRHFNAATAMAFVALVFALTGGAFAATGGGSSPSRVGARGPTATTAKAKAKAKTKAGPRGPAGPAGKTGAAGPAGPAGATGPGGPQGNAGTNGSDGINGTNGTNGTSVSAKTIATSESECAGNGGVKLTPGGSICNGKTGFTSTLPSGKTETGTWGFSAETKQGFFITAVSFPIPLAEPLAGSEVHFVGPKKPLRPVQVRSRNRRQIRVTSVYIRELSVALSLKVKRLEPRSIPPA